MHKLLWLLACVNVLVADDEISFAPDSETSFVDVVDFYRGNDQAISLDVVVNNNEYIVCSSKKKAANRNYYVEVTAQEKADLAYICNTLAKSSLIGLAGSKSSLKKAGDRINQLHPLRFVMTIFTDEELKADIAAIRQRSMVWGDFFGGLEGSLKEESKKGNITYDQVVDFSARIGVDPNSIWPSLQAQRWKEFINILIDTIPRSGEPGRYDM